MENIVIFTDSLGAPEFGWPRVIDKAGFAHIMHVGVGGTKLTEFVWPKWITGNTNAKYKPDRVCLQMGTNDAVKGTQHELIRIWLTTLCMDMVATGLPATVINVPNYPGRQDEMAPVRTIFKEVCGEFEEIDLVSMPFGAYDRMLDEYHPDEGLHWCQAIHMIDHWGLERPG